VVEERRMHIGRGCAGGGTEFRDAFNPFPPVVIRNMTGARMTWSSPSWPKSDNSSR